LASLSSMLLFNTPAYRADFVNNEENEVSRIRCQDGNLQT
jgi:hypothetical protein